MFFHIHVYVRLRTGACGLTLGEHVCLRIAEIEITNYPSQNITIILCIGNT